MSGAEWTGTSDVREHRHGGAAGKPLGDALIANRGRNVHAAGTLSIDRWNGEDRVQFRIMDLAVIDPVVR